MTAPTPAVARLAALTLLATLGALWYASHRSPAQWVSTHHADHTALLTQDGQLVFLAWGVGHTPWVCTPSGFLAAPDTLPATGRGVGFVFFSGHPYDDLRYAQITALAIPWWFPTALAWLLLLYTWRDHQPDTSPAPSTTAAAAAQYLLVRTANPLARPVPIPTLGQGKRWLRSTYAPPHPHHT